jgi:NAD(P)-dependent dehydrogenase (short-subunit alcohol dehydrogenase family)
MATGSAIYPSLKDKRVFISGGGSGIGEALVQAFVEQGARVAFVDIAVAASQALVEKLKPGALHVPRYACVDLCDLKALQRHLAQLQADWGAVDVLVNNAANDDRHGLAEVTPEYFEQRMAVNLRHLFFAAQAVIPGMRAAGGGVILNFGSISWHLALPELVLYQTAKAGIEGMTRAMARDLGVHNIRVNTVVPGGVKTARQDALWHDEAETARILENQCLKQRVMPADVAQLVLFLASDAGRMCTAHSYFVDAGWR